MKEDDQMEMPPGIIREDLESMSTEELLRYQLSNYKWLAQAYKESRDEWRVFCYGVIAGAAVVFLWLLFT